MEEEAWQAILQHKPLEVLLSERSGRPNLTYTGKGTGIDSLLQEEEGNELSMRYSYDSSDSPHPRPHHTRDPSLPLPLHLPPNFNITPTKKPSLTVSTVYPHAEYVGLSTPTAPPTSTTVGMSASSTYEGGGGGGGGSRSNISRARSGSSPVVCEDLNRPISPGTFLESK